MWLEYIKKFYNSTIRRQITQLKNRQRIQIDTSPRRVKAAFLPSTDGYPMCTYYAPGTTPGNGQCLAMGTQQGGQADSVSVFMRLTARGQRVYTDYVSDARSNSLNSHSAPGMRKLRHREVR